MVSCKVSQYLQGKNALRVLAFFVVVLRLKMQFKEVFVLFAEIYEANLHKTKDLASKLLTSKRFFILIEKFFEDYGKTNPFLTEFFYKYFWDGSYVDVWALPLVLLDIFHLNTKTLKFYTKKDKSFLKDLKIVVHHLEDYIVKFLEQNTEDNEQTRKTIDDYRYILRLVSEKIEFIESN